MQRKTIAIILVVIAIIGVSFLTWLHWYSIGEGRNHWQTPINTSTFVSDEYSLRVEPVTSTPLFSSATFNTTGRNSVTEKTPGSVSPDKKDCPVFLTNPPEQFTCPRDMHPRPSTILIADPGNITPAEADAIPVNFPGVERSVLVSTALKDPCVIEFLESGGEIAGIIDQPRPTTGKESVRWPPTLMGYRKVNCTEIFVFFDIDPSARNISRIRAEYR